MKTQYTVALSMLAGVGIGALAVQGLQAQVKPSLAYVVTEVDVTDSEAYLKEYSPRAIKTVEAAGGRWLVRGGKAQSFVGEPPKRVIITAWDSMDKVIAWQRSAEYQEIQPIRAKYSKSVRQFALEGFKE
jgi:uncharacterized protein (DUF1330 family)